MAYIERETVLSKCGWYNTVNGKSICAVRKDELVALPAADVAPVVRGRWVTNAYGQTICSHCELPIPGYWGMYEDCPDGVWTEIGHTQCCPNCGARMED